MADDSKPADDAAANIAALEAKDGPRTNNENAETNEILAARVPSEDFDPIDASIRMNDPTKSRNAYTSHESGFNTDLPRDSEEADPIVPRQDKSETEAGGK
jgi:hypothetical protein